MLDAGNFLWNADIFMFRACDMISAFEKYSLELLSPVGDALGAIKPDLDFLRLDPDAWAPCEDISIDHAIMEQAENLVAVPFFAGCSDLGAWDAVLQEIDCDDNGVALSSNAHAIDCENLL